MKKNEISARNSAKSDRKVGKPVIFAPCGGRLDLKMTNFFFAPLIADFDEIRSNVAKKTRCAGMRQVSAQPVGWLEIQTF